MTDTASLIESNAQKLIRDKRPVVLHLSGRDVEDLHWALAIAKRHFIVKDTLNILDGLMDEGRTTLYVDMVAVYTLVSACQIAIREPIPFWRRWMGVRKCANWPILAWHFYDMVAERHPAFVESMDDGWGLRY